MKAIPGHNECFSVEIPVWKPCSVDGRYTYSVIGMIWIYTTCVKKLVMVVDRPLVLLPRFLSNSSCSPSHWQQRDSKSLWQSLYFSDVTCYIYTCMWTAFNLLYFSTIYPTIQNTGTSLISSLTVILAVLSLSRRLS